MPITLSYTHLTFSEEEFVAYILKRVQKHLRSVLGREKVVCFQGKDPRKEICKRILEELHIQITEKEGIPVRCASLNQICEEFLKDLLLTKGLKETQPFSPIRGVLDEELNILAHIWQLETIVEETSAIDTFIKDVAKRHSQTPFSILKTIDAQ